MNRTINEAIDWTRDTVKLLGKITGIEFAEVFRYGGQEALIRRISDGLIIPKEHLAYNGHIPEYGQFFERMNISNEKLFPNRACDRRNRPKNRPPYRSFGDG